MDSRYNYWVISDTHFGHEKMVRSGYRKEGFEEKIVRNCKHVIRECDMLIHTGDVAFYKNAHWHDKFLAEVRCKRSILVLGNHDRETLTWYYDRGWSFVCSKFELSIYGKYLIFSHRPIHQKELPKGCINIHGHLHDGSYRTVTHQCERHRLVNIEKTMAPVTLKSLVGM